MPKTGENLEAGWGEAAKLPEDIELNGQDFLELERGLRAEGVEIRLIKVDRTPMHAVEAAPELERKWHLPYGVYPHISRSLGTAYNRRKIPAPTRMADRSLALGKLEWYFGYYCDEWMKGEMEKPRLDAFYREGIVSLTEPGKEPLAIELPTKTLDAPFYSAGGSDNHWLGGGGVTSAYNKPITVDVWFSRMNPRFRDYCEITRRKLESQTAEKIAQAHVEVNRKYELGIAEDAIMRASQEYVSKEIPKIMHAIQGILAGTEPVELSTKGEELYFYKDGAGFFITTTTPVIPLACLQKEPTEELNRRYEAAMMQEYADPEVTKLRWADLATAFRVTAGRASADYLTIPQNVWEEESRRFMTGEHEKERKRAAFEKEYKKLPSWIREGDYGRLDYELHDAALAFWMRFGKLPDFSGFTK